MIFKAYLLGGVKDIFPFPNSLEQNVDIITRSEAEATEAKLFKEMRITHKVPDGDCVLAVFSALSDQFVWAGEQQKVPFCGLMVEGAKMPAQQYKILYTPQITAVQLPMKVDIVFVSVDTPK